MVLPQAMLNLAGVLRATGKLHEAAGILTTTFIIWKVAATTPLPPQPTPQQFEESARNLKLETPDENKVKLELEPHKTYIINMAKPWTVGMLDRR